jgi:hypothetical protein
MIALNQNAWSQAVPLLLHMCKAGIVHTHSSNQLPIGRHHVGHVLPRRPCGVWIGIGLYSHLGAGYLDVRHMHNVAPVTNEASSDARNNTPYATSIGSPKRHSGV